jgi:hypothetical protein
MDSRQRYLPIYSEYPEAPSSFVEIYEKLAQNIDWEVIADSCFQVFADPNPIAGQARREFPQMVAARAGGQDWCPQRDTASAVHS